VDNHVDYFPKFWAAYPKKVGKGDALKAWKKIKSPAATYAQIIEALAWQVKQEQWTRENGRFIPNPATYLNQQRWEDGKVIATGAPAAEIPWYQTYAGIQKMAEGLGIIQQPGETTPQFVNRIKERQQEENHV
jgi:hypothetical protein